MLSDNSRPTACPEFIESRLAQITRLSKFMLKEGNCTDPSGHTGEVVNDVYIKVTQSWHSLHSPEDAINTITKNTARTHAYKCRREPPGEMDEKVVPWLTLGAQDPTTYYERAILVGELLDQLDPEDQALIACIFQGLNFAEIEVLWEKPSGTLRSRYSRAIKKLKQANLQLTNGSG